MLLKGYHNMLILCFKELANRSLYAVVLEFIYFTTANDRQISGCALSLSHQRMKTRMCKHVETQPSSIVQI